MATPEQGLFVRVEYDPTYCGGEYDKVGAFALLPVPLVDRLGVEGAFRQVTGLDPQHIVHYTFDELYDADGEPWHGDEGDE